MGRAQEFKLVCGVPQVVNADNTPQASGLFEEVDQRRTCDCVVVFGEKTSIEMIDSSLSIVVPQNLVIVSHFLPLVGLA
jgi:hypothetical protein